MRSVMIVDDELLARLGMKTMVDWQELDYRIVFEAENGLQALEYARKMPPDLILTDVKMPVMDGTTLIQQLKKEQIPSKVIVMSAHDDFQYVKCCMRDGADDYLLKLELSTQQLKDTLNRIAFQADKQEVPTSTERATSVEEYIKNLLYNQHDGSKTVPQKLTDEFSRHSVLYGMKVRFACKDDAMGTMPQNLKQPLQDMLSQVIHNYGKGYIFAEREGEFFCFFQPSDRMQTVPLHHLCESMQKMANMLFNLDCYIGCSLPCADMMVFTEHFQQADAALRLACFLAAKCLVFETTRNDIDIEPATFHEELIALEIAIQSLNLSKIESIFEKINHKIHDAPFVDKEHLNALCYPLLYLMNTLIPQEEAQCSDRLPDKLENFEFRAQYEHWMHEIQKEIVMRINPEGENQRCILEAKKCIQQNYQNNISLDYVAEFLHLSPGYFSKIFKKYIGQGFVEYLTDLRIKHATELLQSGKYMVYEVAAMVGYENASYFSQIYKKKTGISPYKVKSVVDST